MDIVLRPQPKIQFPGCTYYRTLVNTYGIQVRINETVYVKRLIDDRVSFFYLKRNSNVFL